MRIYFRIFTLLMFFAIIVSCKKEIVPELQLSATQVEVPNFNGVIKIQVTSNTDWTTSLSSTWCDITPKSGKGNAEITITANNNFTDLERSVTLLVLCKDLKKTTVIKQTFAQLSIENSTVSFLKAGGSKIFKILSNSKWQMIIPPTVTWITADALSGTGNTDLALTCQPNSVGPERTANVTITYGTSQTTYTVTQERANNTPPTKPTLVAPANLTLNTNRLISFKWSASTDADNDPINYKLSYSKDQITWIDYNTTSTTVSPTSPLDASSTYKWKVTASDAFGGVTVSDIFTFSTGVAGGYADGEFKIYQTGVLGSSPCEILFLGDGYVPSDFEFGGVYDQDANRGIEAFFSVEPYKTYREYFTVYKMAAYSKDNGITQVDKSIVKETCFETKYTGGSGMSINNPKVFEYAKKMPGVTDEKLKNMLIVLIANENRYAGTCWMWSDGRAIAICPNSKSTSIGANFVDIVHHEAGGHGWAGLADEYITSANQGKTITDADKTSYQGWTNLGFNANVDVTGDLANVKWKHFLGKTAYENRVGAFQGALYYTYGAWRAESTSCMINNIPYFSAPAREAAVKKILRVSGGTYSLDNFITKDTQKAPTAAILLLTKSFNPLTFVPLAPPVYNK